MNRLTHLFVGAILLSGTTANAEPPSSRHPKSSALAITISAAATLVPAGVGLLIAQDGSGTIAGGVLVAQGALFGPSCGRLYADDKSPFSLLPVRLVGMGVCLLGWSAGHTSSWEGEGGTAGAVVMAVGGTLYLAGTVMDFVRAPKAVGRYNERAMGAAWQLSPAYFSAAHAVGANLTLRF